MYKQVVGHDLKVIQWIDIVHLIYSSVKTCVFPEVNDVLSGPFLYPLMYINIRIRVSYRSNALLKHINNQGGWIPLVHSLPTGKTHTVYPFESCRCRNSGHCWVPVSEPSSLNSVSRGDKKGSASQPTATEEIRFYELCC